jgi:hypothetical protein
MGAIHLGIGEYKARPRSISRNEPRRNVEFRSYAGFQNARVECKVKAVWENTRIGKLNLLSDVGGSILRPKTGKA